MMRTKLFLLFILINIYMITQIFALNVSKNVTERRTINTDQSNWFDRRTTKNTFRTSGTHKPMFNALEQNNRLKHTTVTITDYPPNNRPTNTERNKDGSNAASLENWKILTESRKSPVVASGVTNGVLSNQKCTLTREGRCLRKVKRRKNNGGVNKTMSPKMPDKKDGSLVSSNNLMHDKNDKQLKNESESKDLLPGELNKLSIKLSSDACACFWRQDKCGCVCNGSLNYDDFQELSRTFLPCENFTFILANGHFHALPPNLFSKIRKVKQFNLHLINSTCEYLCDPTPMTSPFRGIEFTESAQMKLTHVTVRQGWNWTPFEQLKSSSGAEIIITVQDSKLKRLTSDFARMAGGHVQTVDISDSDLHMVGSNAFGTFENMTHFRVPRNKLKQLRRSDFFQILYNLEELDLRNNELNSLDGDLFTNMPSIKEIFLSGNPLTVLPETTFQAVIRQAHLVGIAGIPLTCDCRLQWLKDSVLLDNATRENIEGAVCRRPSYLRGMPFDRLSKEHLLCL